MSNEPETVMIPSRNLLIPQKVIDGYMESVALCNYFHARTKGRCHLLVTPTKEASDITGISGESDLYFILAAIERFTQSDESVPPPPPITSKKPIIEGF